MRPSRVAKETSRFFDSSATPVLPRRSTRVSLARFAYNGANTNPPSALTAAAPEQADAEVTVGSDIEDAVKPAVQRKRKRTATVAQPSPRRVSTRARTTRTEIKTEVKTEVKNETKSEIKSDPDSDAEDVKPETTTPAKPRGRVRKPARTTTDPTTGTTTVHPPTDWEQTYAVAKEMRLTGLAANAAVDTMGCERLADPNASARDRRFQTLVALMLSSQTKDTVNAAAMARLRTELPPHTPGAPPGLNLENMLAVDPVLLNELIGKVGFHNNKTKYLKTTASILQSHHGSDIPPTIAGLTSLPGVGPKMAHLCMSATNGWNRVEGIGVDVHVHRITNLWGWQSPATKTPEETRKALESWLPRDKWKEINWLLVGLGQTVCAPVGRKCGDCEVGLAGLCKGADRGRLAEGRRRRGVVKGEEVGVKVEGLKTEGVKVEDEDGVKMEGVEEKVKVEEGVEMEEGVELEEAKMEKVKAEGDQVDEDQVGEVKMEGVEMQGVETGEVEEKRGGIKREETKEGVEIEEAKVQEGMKMELEDDAEMEGVELEGAKVEGLKVEGVEMEKVKVEGGENKGQVEDEDGGVVIKKEEAIGFEQVQRVVKVSSPSVKEEDIGN